MDGQLSHKNFYRTLIRLESINSTHVTVIIPGWDHSCPVEIPINEVPRQVIENAYGGQPRCHAQVNIGVETSEELEFKDWEFE